MWRRRDERRVHTCGRGRPKTSDGASTLRGRRKTRTFGHHMSNSGARASASAGKAAAAKLASAGKAGAAAMGKAAATAAGSKAFVAGGTVLTFGARRALWPAFLMGGAFSSAAWFGCFEISDTIFKLFMPVPAKPNDSARTTGLLTLPVTASSTCYLGWWLCPPLAPPPTSFSEVLGWASRAIPVRHFAIAGAASAVTTAGVCRVVQYRGGA